LSERALMKISISGSIGSGKSMACEYLRSKGFDVFDCDRENSILLQKGQEGYKQVKEAFPEAFADNELDKKILSDLVFSDDKKRKKLEEIMHPLILKKMMERKDDPLFAEVPLLFESGWEKYFDRNLLIVVDEKIAIERLIERGLDKKEAKRRLKAQMSVVEKIKRADKIIYNNDSLSDLYRQIDEWLKEILC
jgi:dephospho-CoA kinase